MRNTNKLEKSYLLTAVWYLEVKKPLDSPLRIVTTGQNHYIGFYRTKEEAEKYLSEKTDLIRMGAYKYVTLRCSSYGNTYDDGSLSMVSVYRWNDDIRKYEKMSIPFLVADEDMENSLSDGEPGSEGGTDNISDMNEAKLLAKEA